MVNAQWRQGALTPRQLQTFNQLLALGGERPFSEPDLAQRLSDYIQEGTSDAVMRWTEKSLRLSKAQISLALTCEGDLKAQSEKVDRSPMNAPTAVGIVSHRAIQIAYTHPGLSAAEQVRAALTSSRVDEIFDAWWIEVGAGMQSDMIMQITSRVVNFLDDWPPLEEAWSPRFEEPLSAKIGRLTLSARADLIIGRPRSDLKQSLLICDLKSGNLKDEHEDEAMFYALIATMRHGVAPWRSIIYSLAAGEYTPPDVTEERLFEAAERVIKGVTIYVDVMTEARGLVLTPGKHCGFCPARLTCLVSEVRK